MVIKPGQVLILNQQQCRALVTDEEVVELVEKVLGDYARGDAVNPIKGHMPFFPDHNGWINSMPSWLRKENVAGIKWAGMGEDNPKKHNLPQCSATIILNDTDTAFPIAVMDGTGIMAWRTGAAAAIMAKYCCKSNAKTLTVVGAGVQGTSAFHMMMITLPKLSEIRVMDIRKEAVDQFIDEGKERYPHLIFKGYGDLAPSIAGSDIVLTAVHGNGAEGDDILDYLPLDKGTTLVSIAGGLSLHKIRDRCDWSVMDFTECFVHRINETIGYMKEVFGVDQPALTTDIADVEIGDVIIGKALGRQNDEQIVHAAGVGMSIEDLIVAHTVFMRAVERDIGVVVDLIN